MADYYHKARVIPLGRKLDASDLRSGDDVAGDANHEQVAESLVEYQLGWDSRV